MADLNNDDPQQPESQEPVNHAELSENMRVRFRQFTQSTNTQSIQEMPYIQLTSHLIIGTAFHCRHTGTDGTDERVQALMLATQGRMIGNDTYMLQPIFSMNDCGNENNACGSRFGVQPAQDDAAEIEMACTSLRRQVRWKEDMIIN